MRFRGWGSAILVAKFRCNGYAFLRVAFEQPSLSWVILTPIARSPVKSAALAFPRKNLTGQAPVECHLRWGCFANGRGMAENGTSWLQEGNSWRKTTAHGRSCQKTSIPRFHALSSGLHRQLEPRPGARPAQLPRL